MIAHGLKRSFVLVCWFVRRGAVANDWVVIRVVVVVIGGFDCGDGGGGGGDRCAL